MQERQGVEEINDTSLERERERMRWLEGREARSFEDTSSEIDCGTAIVHSYITAELKLGMNLSLLLTRLFVPANL